MERKGKLELLAMIRRYYGTTPSLEIAQLISHIEFHLEVGTAPAIESECKHGPDCKWHGIPFKCCDICQSHSKTPL